MRLILAHLPPAESLIPWLAALTLLLLACAAVLGAATAWA